MNKQYPVGKQGQTTQLIGKLTLTLAGVVALLLGSVYFLSIFTENNGMEATLKNAGVFLFLMGWFVMIALGQLAMFSDVEVSDAGITIHFLTRPILIAWESITEIRHSMVGLQRIEVYARHVSWFHQIFLGGLVRPVFWLDATMKDVDEIAAEIERRSPLRATTSLRSIGERFFASVFPIVVTIAIVLSVVLLFPQLKP